MLILRLGTAAQYFYAYWSLALLDTALQFAIGYEVAPLFSGRCANGRPIFGTGF
ncbi:hypothetical protein ACPOL_0765 [Acidisarcina polymorpha]|uniref:Uncharacterized protein n=1 Tax=Acidisarcina polymorpha TaxID=2211140 RepID=A0A2Z5FUG1_9BACT|nr:hypothetical protein ACPOL_0765 [Acidisarcina polymorpha]